MYPRITLRGCYRLRPQPVSSYAQRRIRTAHAYNDESLHKLTWHRERTRPISIVHFLCA
nr:MAG TPA: hypothetical protein [Inoviridae sp.]